MKKGIVLLMTLAVSALLLAHGNEMKSTKITVNGKNVQIDYGSPDLKGRNFSDTPVGTVWRMGADRTTTLATEAALSFGDAKVPAGSYSLLAEKTAGDQWTLIISSEERPRGKNRDKEADVATVLLKTATVEKSQQHLDIQLKSDDDGTALTVIWGTTQLSTAFSAE